MYSIVKTAPQVIVGMMNFGTTKTAIRRWLWDTGVESSATPVVNKTLQAV
jgi:hypothetical protein